MCCGLLPDSETFADTILSTHRERFERGIYLYYVRNGNNFYKSHRKLSELRHLADNEKIIYFKPCLYNIAEKKTILYKNGRVIAEKWEENGIETVWESK
jgi:hypothetical protein